MTFTDKQKHDAAAREVKQRKRVYPRLVSDGRMTQAFADEQIAIMQPVLRGMEPMTHTTHHAEGR